jgi:hypothetical protein
MTASADTVRRHPRGLTKSYDGPLTARLCVAPAAICSMPLRPIAELVGAGDERRSHGRGIGLQIARVDAVAALELVVDAFAGASRVGVELPPTLRGRPLWAGCAGRGCPAPGRRGRAARPAAPPVRAAAHVPDRAAQGRRDMRVFLGYASVKTTSVYLASGEDRRRAGRVCSDRATARRFVDVTAVAGTCLGG